MPARKDRAFQLQPGFFEAKLGLAHAWREAVHRFMTAQRYGVVSTVGSEGTPQSAAVGIAIAAALVRGPGRPLWGMAKRAISPAT